MLIARAAYRRHPRLARRVLDSETEEAYQQLIGIAARCCGASWSGISLIDDECQVSSCVGVNVCGAVG